MNRFLTPAEAGRMSDTENKMFSKIQADINAALANEYVPGLLQGVSVQIGQTTPRVRQKVKEGLEAAGWTVNFLSLEAAVISDKQKTGPLVVDKRSRRS